MLRQIQEYLQFGYPGEYILSVSYWQGAILKQSDKIVIYITLIIFFI